MVSTCRNCNIELSFLYHIVFYLGFHFGVEGRRLTWMLNVLMLIPDLDGHLFLGEVNGYNLLGL